MQEERFKVVPFVSVILRNGSDILLIKRINTGVEDGMFACAGGGIDGNETIVQAAIREAAEELGITLKKECTKVVHILHRKYPHGQEMIGFYIEATEWDGVPSNMEPHKCDDVKWFDLKELPENCQPSLKQVVSMVDKNIFFSEMGWE